MRCDLVQAGGGCNDHLLRGQLRASECSKERGKNCAVWAGALASGATSCNPLHAWGPIFKWRV
eukprot:888425-Pelagomonas_calceolata.AAC.9